MTTLKIGIATKEQYKARTMAIARGEYQPAPDEPKIWFSSMTIAQQTLASSKSNTKKK